MQVACVHVLVPPVFASLHLLQVPPVTGMSEQGSHVAMQVLHADNS